MSIIDYYIKNNHTRLDISFGSDDMVAGIMFNDKIEKKTQESWKKCYMYNHDNLSEMKFMPFKKVSFNFFR